jgi:mono/diheme cytochrome c family protein
MQSAEAEQNQPRCHKPISQGTAIEHRTTFQILVQGEIMIVKNTTIAIAAVFFFSLVFLSAAPAQDEAQPSDAGAYYRTKCVVCHGQKAEKKFDASLSDEQCIDAILKGKKPEKPPNMPAYGERGVTADQAKALLDHIKQLRSGQ